MASFNELDRDPPRRELLKFGGLMLAVGVAAGAYATFVRHSRGSGMVLGGVGLALFALSFVPPLNRWLYVAWMTLGVVMGMVTSPIILGVIYLVLFVPIGLLFRFRGRDAMRRKMKSPPETYWEDYEESSDPKSYLKQH